MGVIIQMIATENIIQCTQDACDSNDAEKNTHRPQLSTGDTCLGIRISNLIYFCLIICHKFYENITDMWKKFLPLTMFMSNYTHEYSFIFNCNITHKT